MSNHKRYYLIPFFSRLYDRFTLALLLDHQRYFAVDRYLKVRYSGVSIFNKENYEFYMHKGKLCFKVKKSKKCDK